MQHHNPQTHPHGNATHSHLRLRDSHDAHILFQAVRQGHLPLIRKRLTGPEQQALHAGQVFVWADREGSLERWTDGHNWSPSRVRGPFLMYDEMPEDTDAFLRRKAQQKAGERRVKQPRKKRLPPLPGGLSKQTYSATLIQNGVDIQKWHLTAYFKDDGNADNLITPDEDNLLRTIIVPENTFKSSMSRKSKGSSSSRARRGSLSEHRSTITADDDEEEGGLRESPIDENSPLRTFPSPPLQPVLGPFDASAAFGSGLPLPWETGYHAPGQQLRTPSSFGSSQDDNNSGGSSNGSVNTERGYFLPPPGSSSAGTAAFPNQLAGNAAYNRGRPMHLEGIHTRFDAVGGPAFNLSALSPPSAISTSSDFMSAGGNQRSLSLSGLPSSNLPDWRPFDSSNPVPNALDERRGSLMSIGSSRSASSTSSKVPGLSAGGTSTNGGSNSSSPASSSWSQQSPYLAPANWPQQQNVGGKFNTSPLVPSSLPSSSNSYGNSGRSSSQLPSHIQHHPEMVQSAVPPPNQPQVPGRRATLPPLLYQGDNSAAFGNWNSSGYYNNVSANGQGATSTPPFPPSNGPSYVPGNLPSPFGEVPVPSGLPSSSSSSSSSSSYFPNRPLSSEPASIKTSPTLPMHQPRAAVPPSGLPGSWEQANSSSTISFDYSTGLATSESLNSPSYGVGPPQKTIGSGQP
ncbi:hypothetical protein FRC00_007440, partial [Tulasnella sp. 408]